MLSYRALIARFLCLTSLAVWFGGFTFYAAFVVHELHEAIGNLEGGLITQKVTNWLNLMGGLTLAIWWPTVWIERRTRPVWIGRGRLLLLAANTALLLGLVALHRVLDTHLESSGLRGFYPRHQLYLWISVAQWLLNFAMIASSLAAWSIHDRLATSESR